MAKTTQSVYVNFVDKHVAELILTILLTKENGKKSLVALSDTHFCILSRDCFNFQLILFAVGDKKTG